jgi:STE24 endopeptidase
MAEPLQHFTAEEIQRAREYHRPLYGALAIDAVVRMAVLAVLAFSSLGDYVYGWLAGLSWWSRVFAYTVLVVALAGAVRLPISYWRGYVHEKRWGFSTQNVRGWLIDRAKALAIGAGLTASALFGLVALARALPWAWPAAAAPAAAVLVAVLSFAAPVLLEPVFNRFTPLADERLASDLRVLAQRAGVSVRDVLVADATRRTRKQNAYVSGFGRTRRVVVYDTLLAEDDPREIRLVVAHELGHRKAHHVEKVTALGMIAAAGGVLLLWGLLSMGGLLRTAGAAGPGDPRVVPLVLLSGAILQLLALPFESSLSRRWEAAADLASLELTGDPGAFESAHRKLAVSNLIDLDPPRALYLIASSHPTPPERIAAARDWARKLKRRSPATKA